MKKIAEVIVDISSSEVDKVFSYLIDDEEFFIGDRVIVPFGTKQKEGFIIDIVDFEEKEYQLKEVSYKLDEFTCILPEHIKLMKYMKDEMHLRYIDCLRLFLPSKMRGNKIHEAVEFFIEKSCDFEDKISRVSSRAKKQLEIIEYFKNNDENVKLSDLKNLFSYNSIAELIKNEILIKKEIVVYRKPYTQISGKDKSHKLTAAQNDALEQINNSQERIVLLKGVTGSGKTEVYMRLISAILLKGKNAILLVPEIGLTPQTLKIFKARFGERIAMLHSGLTDGERYDEWRRILFDECDIVIGARSAIFAPLKDIGLIVIDEEHDTSYVSDSNPRYKTVDIAEFRANYHNAKIILGSATPSIESFYKSKIGTYKLVRIDQRANDMVMPDIKIINMSEQVLRGNITPLSFELIDKLNETVNKNQQAMIFINRRGYSSYITCASCGYTPTCNYCDSKLSYHKKSDLLICHYCDRRYKYLNVCPKCGKETIKYGKIGTQKVEEIIKNLVPNARILRMDSDTTSRKDSLINILTQFNNQEANILIGTQMIAKGHDFPNVTLVGILDADMGLYVSDYKANERTFQLITQVAGRAGRGNEKGEVILQTYQPKSHVIGFAIKHDYDSFYDHEIAIRQTTFFPPFSTLIRILIISKIDTLALNITKKILGDIKKEVDKTDIIYLQGNKAIKEYIDSKYRYNIIMRVENLNSKEIIDKVFQIVDSNQERNVSVFVEIDPKAIY